MPESLSVELAHYLSVSGIIFGAGIAVALSKRNAIAVLMGIELMLNGVSLAFIAFARFGDNFGGAGGDPLAGHVFVIFVLTVAAAEAAVALAFAVLVYRRRETVDLDRINLMRW
ncbi:MAG: NADH-quinone oxidoreductase subunit NuoK [Dehalococcoidia bacterium]